MFPNWEGDVRDKIIITILLVMLMYLPYLLKGSLEGLSLYIYWSLIAFIALVYGWITTKRWSRNE